MPAEEDYARVSDLADEFGYEGEEKENYISEHMSRKGYKETRGWADPDPDPGADRPKTMFGSKTPAPKREREVQPRSGQYR